MFPLHFNTLANWSKFDHKDDFFFGHPNVPPSLHTLYNRAVFCVHECFFLFCTVTFPLQVWDTCRLCVFLSSFCSAINFFGPDTVIRYSRMTSKFPVYTLSSCNWRTPAWLKDDWFVFTMLHKGPSDYISAGKDDSAVDVGMLWML